MLLWLLNLCVVIKLSAKKIKPFSSHNVPGLITINTIVTIDVYASFLSVIMFTELM